MFIKEIFASRMVQVGEKNPLTISMSMKAELDELDNEAASSLELNRRLREALLSEIQEAYESRGQSAVSRETLRARYGL